MQCHGVHLLPQRSVRLGGKLGVRWEQDKKGQTKTFGICLVPALFCDLALPSHDCARWEQGREGANKNFRDLSRSSPLLRLSPALTRLCQMGAGPRRGKQKLSESVSLQPSRSVRVGMCRYRSLRMRLRSCVAPAVAPSGRQITMRYEAPHWPLVPICLCIAGSRHAFSH